MLPHRVLFKGSSKGIRIIIITITITIIVVVVVVVVVILFLYIVKSNGGCLQVASVRECFETTGALGGCDFFIFRCNNFRIRIVTHLIVRLTLIA